MPNSSFAEIRMGLFIEQTHMEDEMQITIIKRKMKETVKSAEWRVEEYQDNYTMGMIHGWRARKTLWANVTCDIVISAVKQEKKWRVRVHVHKWRLGKTGNKNQNKRLFWTSAVLPFMTLWLILGPSPPAPLTSTLYPWPDEPKLAQSVAILAQANFGSKPPLFSQGGSVALW